MYFVCVFHFTQQFRHFQFNACETDKIAIRLMFYWVRRNNEGEIHIYVCACACVVWTVIEYVIPLYVKQYIYTALELE